MDNSNIVQTQAVVASPRRYGGVAMTLHWLTFFLLAGLFGTIWMREQASDGDMAAALLMLHRSFGALVWLVTLGRLARMVGHTPRLPSTISRSQRWLARANECSLYLLLIA